VLIYNHLAESKIAPPPRKSKFASEFEGAYVKDPILRLYGWGMSFDFASLYPTIIRQWNLSPETLVRDDHAQITVDTLVKGELGNWAKYVKDNDYTIAANGSMYHRNKKGILPTMMEMLMIGRKVAKKEMLKVEQEYQITKDETLVPQISALNNRQLALKILANAGYGAITNVGFRYYELAIGEAITLTGQASDKHIEKSLDEYMNKMLKTKGVSYVTYADTDSVYLDVDPLVNAIMPNKDIDSVVKLLDKIGLEIQKGPIQNSIDFIYNECNCFEKLMDMKREAIYSRGLWTAKKRYALKVHNSEGVDYKPYKLKIMGLEIIKASTPQKVRKKLKDAVTVIFEQDESSLQQFVKDYQTEFATYPPEDMAFPRSVKDMDKWKEGNGGYKKGTPIHVRAAILYNAYYGTNIGQELMNGDKMKFISLKEPNIIKEDVIGFPSTGKMPVLVIPLPVDVDKMFNMTFIRPLEAIATAIGWSLEEKASLEDFFG
jgi:DNA polymerase elongation subunit (family B)